mgnify:CR=1 FL=1
MKRQKSRGKAMELLFSMEISKNSYEETIENFIEDYEMDLNTIDVEYIKNVVKVVTDNIEAIDEKIIQSLVNWKLDRVSKVNLTIIKISSRRNDVCGRCSRKCSNKWSSWIN